MPPHAYIEHDGRVLVSEQGDAVTLPSVDAVEVPFETYVRRTVRGEEVVFGQAELDEHPYGWPRKDELAHDPRATPLLHAAINASLFRPVVGVVVRDGDEILLVKPARGVAAGHWTLPGGFVNAFEEPVHAAGREVLEETGIEVDELSLEATITYDHPGSPYPILGLGFTARPRSREIQVREEEIAEARWIGIDEALEDASGLAAQVLERLIKGATR